MVGAPRTPAAQSSKPTLDELLVRTGVYTQRAIVGLSNVVCEEDYIQEGKGWPTLRRRLSSELLLVRHPVETDNWVMFRDTISVDGKPVADRSERITQLFVKPTGDSLARARAISANSERHHLVRPPPLVADPMLGVAVLQFRYQSALKFTLHGLDPEIGPSAAVIEFEQPPVSRGRGAAGQKPSVPGPVLNVRGGKGRAWIEPLTGRIVKTDVRVAIDQGRNTTTFARDQHLGIDRPSEMRTSWPGRGAGNTITGVATYGNCRRFGVETSETLLPPK
jgi:hypothetical protein